MTISEIMQAVMEHPTRFVVVTGGEPMIAKGMSDLLAELQAAGKHITIETAGTVAPAGVACDLASLSPKLANSSPLPSEIEPAWIKRHDLTRLQPAVLREWCQGYEFQLKFVISDAADIAETAATIESIGIPIPPERILVMPEGTSVDALREKTELLVAACKKRGWRYSPRLHIDLFGNTRAT